MGVMSVMSVVSVSSLGDILWLEFWVISLFKLGSYDINILIVLSVISVMSVWSVVSVSSVEESHPLSHTPTHITKNEGSVMSVVSVSSDRKII